ncbi:DHA2 family efflux MFS transporter permease subunit [Kribbella yunnanensis]|uniref:DHA2 family efflux MFS transporter permease subunit n=1 Tax=Kribbella yunnanensis TaxID=190194 RepID=A0ABP4TRX8_9ACTN
MPIETEVRPAGRLKALVVLCVMQLMIILDGTVVTVALPTLQRDLGFSPAGLAWVMNSYLIAFAALLLLAGRLGDLIGGKRVFVAGLGLFTAASLLCGIANSAEVLIAGRFLQGVGGALASAVIIGMIVGLFPAPGEQARAMGIYSFTSASGASIGLIFGGLITETIGWHWAFLINVPIGLIALLFAQRLLTREQGLGLGKGADVLRAALVAVLRMFRSRQMTAANLVVMLLFAAGYGFQFMTALYLQRVLGYDSLATGLAFLPAPIMNAVMSLSIAPRLTVRYGARRMLIVGLAMFALALLWLSQAPVDGSYVVNVAPALAVMGAGIGLAIPAAIMLAMGAADPTDAGLASGLNNTAQQAGAAIGTAVLATLAAATTSQRLSDGAGELLALRDGYGVAWLAAAGFVATGLVLALGLIRRR